MKTTTVLTCYRIGDPNGLYPIFDTTGSRLAPGRWNTPASPMIYTGEHYSTAMLEKLVHGNGILPPNQHCIRITIPNGIEMEVFSQHHHLGWDAADQVVSRAYGDAWWHAQRSAILVVPSVPARMEKNILINLGHPDAAGISHGMPEPVWWDTRLYN